MPESVFAFDTRGSTGVARVVIDEVVHPDQLDRVGREFREYVVSTNLKAYVLDLSGLRYLTSASIGMLLNLHAHLASDARRFAVVADTVMVAETLSHPQLAKIFPVCTTVDAAVAALA